MRQKLRSASLTILALLTIALPFATPSLAFAAANTINANVFNPTILAGPLTLCVGSPSVNSGGNTLPTCNNLCDLIAQIAQIIYFAIAVVIWIVTPVLVTVGGIMIMLGGASSELVGRGKKTITGAVWGIVIVLCAWLIVFTFVNAFGGLSKYVAGFGSGNGTSCIATGSTNANTNPGGAG